MDKSYTSKAMPMFYAVSGAGAAGYLMYRGGSVPALTSAYLLPVAGGVATSYLVTKGLTAQSVLSDKSMAIASNGGYNYTGIATSAALGAVGAAATQSLLL